MKIGIIGSSGYLGSNLSSYLEKKYTIKKFSSFKKLKKKWVMTVCKEINKFKPNIIVNCSASQTLNDDSKSIEKIIYSNLYAQSIFLSEAKKKSSFKGFITFGSRTEYDQSGKYNPHSFYAASKHASDYLLQYFINNKITVVVLKIFDTYGKNDNRKKILTLLLKNYKNKKILNLTPGKQEIDYVNILDICRLISQVSKDINNKKIKGFKKFTVSSKKPLKLVEIIKILKKNLKNELKIKLGILKYRKNECMKCSRKIFNYPKWKPKYSLKKELVSIFDGN
ncbi:NAD-dependent epimerase/dehydratase family protein [Candidatus Pelagibacter sp.]|nr:NAD-dependent epimerase/dehydratase family protein [Candidatus Pelagibacter sp.]